MAVTFDGLQALAETITAAGVQASLDPEALNLPGAWVTLEQFTRWTVQGGMRLQAAVYLIVPNTDHRRALVQLADLFNTVTTVLSPDGPVVAQGVLLPSAPSEPMPALRVPIHLNG